MDMIESKPMTDEELRQQLVYRYTTARRPLGRWRLNFYVAWKRQSWRIVVGSALILKRALDIIGSFFALILLSPLFFLRRSATNRQRALSSSFVFQGIAPQQTVTNI